MPRRSTPRRLGTGAAALGAAAFAYAALLERNMFTLRRLNVPVLPPGSESLRVLHLSDAHLTPAQHVKRRWISKLVDTDPDLVLVTGDNMARVDAVPAVLRAYGPLLDRPGAFVFGSNDYTGPVLRNPLSYFQANRAYIHGSRLPTDELRDALTGAGWVDLNNARTTIQVGSRAVELAGVGDPHVQLDKYSKVGGVADPAIDIHIGLTHAPEPRIVDAMAADGFDLVLAGHTHGGQVRVPLAGALVTNCGLDRRMARGLRRWGKSGTWLHVSAGLGTSPTAPFRLFCPPEASLLALTRK